MHDIDLARIAPRPIELQRKQLEQIRHGRPPFSYNPLRGCFHDIFNVQPEMFGPVAPSEWSIVEGRLRNKCRTDDELDANRLVARGLHEFAVEAQMLGRAQEFFPLAMSVGQKVNYWLSIVLAVDGQPLVPFIDPRRSSRGLTQEARRFVFSMMHERIRAADPDYESVSLAIFQFDDGDGERRSPKLYTDEGGRTVLARTDGIDGRDDLPTLARGLRGPRSGHAARCWRRARSSDLASLCFINVPESLPAPSSVGR